MGKGSKPTVGYWYLLAYHAGLGIGPFDQFLEFRGGDKTAWAGKLAASGTIHINAPNLWGGEKDQGGIVGDVDVMFGENDQEPNQYLIDTFGDQQPAWRGLATLAFKGGKFGAMSPYPQPASYKICKILKGWDGEVCWYPEKAQIGLVGGSPVSVMILAGDEYIPSPDGVDWSADPVAIEDGTITYAYLLNADGRYMIWRGGFSLLYTDALGEPWQTSTDPLVTFGGTRNGDYHNGVLLICGYFGGLDRSVDRGVTFTTYSYPGDVPPFNHIGINQHAAIGMSNNLDYLYWTSPAGLPPWTEGAEHGLITSGAGFLARNADEFLIGGESALGGVGLIITVSGTSVVDQDLPTFAAAEKATCGAFGAGVWVVGTDSGEIAYRLSGVWYLSTFSLGEGCIKTVYTGSRFVMIGSTAIAHSINGQDDWALSSHAVVGGLYDIAVAHEVDADLVGMNPAHALYYARTHREIGREPIANINDASYRAAADKLHAEGFGICTEYDPSTESLIEFEQRICKLIGGSVNRSLVDGQYYLDLARGDYVLEDLPVLTDDDILSFSEQPSILDNAINSVSVKYFDPMRKESIVTPPVQALALIDAFGTTHQVNDYPEIPTAELASRIAERDLRASVTPTRAFDLTTKRTPYGWRPNTYFRLQAPKRGIADMVCILGSKETGTLKSGAIKIAAAQDIYNLPDASFVEVEHGVDTRPPQTPVPIVLQRAFEAPYIELAGALSRADLEVLQEDTGYLLTVAVDPATSRDYTALVAPDGGLYAEVNNGDWCPTAEIVEAAGYDDTEFTLAGASRLSEVVVGSAALWEDELCRVDAIDIGAGTITLGRGCGDTIRDEHSAGARIWFYDGAVAVDTTQYTAGETVGVKLLTNTGSQQLAEGLATAMSLTFDQRQSRPYPPGLFRINGETSPAAVLEEGVVTWAHRDRLLQADQLVDSEMASIGPEATTRYGLRLFDDTDTLIVERLDIAGDTATFVLDYTGDVALELFSISDLGQSWQRHERTFSYTPPAGPVTSVITAPVYAPTDEIIDAGEVTP